MGPHVNGRMTNLMGITALVIMSVAAIALLYLEWFQ
jgi:hypothetical protein